MLSIALPPEIESRLKGEASRQGLAAEELVRKLIVEHLQPVGEEESLETMFGRWEAEDGTDDPSEINHRNQEVEEFKQAMNRNRLEMEGPGSRKPFP